MIQIGTVFKLQIPDVGLTDVKYAGRQEQGDFFTYEDPKGCKKIILLKDEAIDGFGQDNTINLRTGHESGLNVLTSEYVNQQTGLRESLGIMGLGKLV